MFDRTIEVRAPKENELECDFCRNQTNSITKANNMQQPNVIIGCSAKPMKICSQNQNIMQCNIRPPNQNIMQCNMQQPHVPILLCKLGNICGLNHNKYISYEHWNLQIYKIKTIRNTKNLGHP